MSPVFWGLEFCFQFIEAPARRGAGRAPLVVKQDGGFTFVVGNPPYFLESREHKDAFSLYAKSPLVSKYYESKMDIFYFFIELGLDLLEPDGVLGYIIMEYWNTRAKTRKLQARIMADSVLEKLIKFHEFKVFGSAKGQHNDIVIIRKLPAGTSTCKEYPLVVINVVGKDIPGSHVNDLLNEDSLKRLLETTPVPVFFRWDEGIKLVFSLDKSTWFEACRFSTSFGSLLPAPFIAELQHQARSLQDNDLIRRNRLVVVNDIANHEISIMEPLIRLLAEKIGAAGTTSIPAASMTNGLQTYVDRLTRGLLPKIPLAKRRAMRIEENDGIFVLSIEECGKMALSGREMALMKNFYHADQVDSFFIDITNPRKLIYSPKNYITRDRHDLNELARELAGTMDGCPGGEPGTGHLRGQGRGSVPVPFIEAAEARLVKETCEMFPAITSHLLKFQDVITSDRKPFGIHRSREPRFFEGTTRIVSVRKTTYPKFVLVEGTECFMDEGVNVILCDGLPCNPKALVAFLNSMLVFFWIKHVKEARHGDVLQVDLHVIASIPLVDAVVNSVELARLHDVIVKGMKCMKCMKSGATGNQVDEIGGSLVARDEARAIHDATCQVHDARARVDAAVFKGYGLDKTDVLNVMHALNVPAAVQRDIICHLEKME